MPGIALGQATGGSPVPSVAAATDVMPFPTTLAGAPLEVRTYSGPEWLAAADDGSAEAAAYADELVALLGTLGRSPEDLTVVAGLGEPSEGNQAVVIGLTLAGSEPRTYVDELVGVLLGDIESPQLRLRPLGRRWVLRVVDAAVPGVYPRTIFIDGQNAWIMGGDEEYVLEMLDQLPVSSMPLDPGAEVVSDRLPVVLEGRRRAGLYEALEPLFLPSIAEQLGDPFERWMLDLYLQEGITPTQMVGVIAWWGLQSSEDSIEVEGYQVPGATPEMVERLRSEILLGGDEALEGEVSRVQEELGGRQVTTIDLGGSRKHIFGNGDTVWVVTDHIGEPAFAEAAIAALQ
jgi:hypothetical protein